MNNYQPIYPDTEDPGLEMIKLAKFLYPLNRTLMGPDIRLSLKKFKEINPEFKFLEIKSGKKVFDWEIPEEWIINEAYIEHESGKRFAEFKKNNLHIMGYSKAVNEILSKDNLIKKIHTRPELTSAIPYVTSYYKKDWGFCMSHEDLLNLPDGNYKVLINSQHKAGNLSMIEAIIPGKYEKEIFFSSYLCHPSMANNELSGPVLLNQILKYVKSIKNRNYTYRFVILPETIGSIAYLSKRLKLLKHTMLCGFNLTCVGDERSYSHIESRNGNNLADNALRSALKGLNNVKEYSFLERGSDERQYSSPGIDLPVCTFCRSKFGSYPEYHTSKDDFKVVTAQGLKGSYEVIKNIVKAFEIGIYPTNQILCEPQLGKRNLYPQLSKRYQKVNPAKKRMNILAYSDSKRNIFEISHKINMNLNELINEIQELKKYKIIKTKHFKNHYVFNYFVEIIIIKLIKFLRL